MIELMIKAGDFVDKVISLQKQIVSVLSEDFYDLSVELDVFLLSLLKGKTTVIKLPRQDSIVPYLLIDRYGLHMPFNRDGFIWNFLEPLRNLDYIKWGNSTVQFRRVLKDNPKINQARLPVFLNYVEEFLKLNEKRKKLVDCEIKLGKLKITISPYRISFSYLGPDLNFTPDRQILNYGDPNKRKKLIDAIVKNKDKLINIFDENIRLRKELGRKALALVSRLKKENSQFRVLKALQKETFTKLGYKLY